MSFRTALFDLDGTLLDHFSAIHRSYCHTLPQLGLPAPTLQAVRNAVGGGLEQAMLRFIQPGQLTDALRIYRAYFNRTML
ncbi:MAG: HAD hydrolase-like protein, partial [Verrucomicrobiales bacterium]|nr:HAD hydrolase-like protein [Verrucomicrobiales bacterium]